MLIDEKYAPNNKTTVILSFTFLILGKSKMTCFTAIQYHQVKISWDEGCYQEHLVIKPDEADFVAQNITCCNIFLKISNSNYF